MPRSTVPFVSKTPWAFQEMDLGITLVGNKQVECLLDEV